MDPISFKKEKQVAAVTLILGIVALLTSPFPLILLQENSVATSILKAGAGNSVLNIVFCGSLFVSIFAVVNGLGYLLNNSHQAGKKPWYFAVVGTGFGLVNLLLAFAVWFLIARFGD